MDEPVALGERHDGVADEFDGRGRWQFVVDGDELEGFLIVGGDLSKEPVDIVTRAVTGSVVFITLLVIAIAAALIRRR